MTRSALTHLIAAVVATTAVSASAQTVIPTVEVRGRSDAPSTDVRSVCPAIDREMQDALVRAVRRVGEASTVDVSFVVNGNRLEEVKVRGDVRAYRQAVRWAVNSLHCKSQVAQLTQFQIEFIDVAVPGRTQFALVTR